MKIFRNGFTMGELMVCLAIIACIAAMLIPAVVSKRPNKNKAMFRKAYYIAERVVTELINNDDLYPSDLDERQGFAYYDTEETSSSANTGVDFCKYVSRKLNTTGDIDCESAHVLTEGTVTTPTFTTNDGVDWYFPVNQFCDPEYETDSDAGCSYPSSSSPACPTSKASKLAYTCIWMDVNGRNTIPNTFSDTNKTDRFKIYVYYNGKIQVDSNSAASKFLQSKTIF